MFPNPRDPGGLKDQKDLRLGGLIYLYTMDDLVQHILKSTEELEAKATRLELEGRHREADEVCMAIEDKKKRMAEAWGNFLRKYGTLPGAEREGPKEIKKWKAITITNANNFSVEDINDRIKKAFSNEKFDKWAACVEHLGTNRHIHAVARFTRESKWKPYDFRQYLEKYFPNPFDISKFDSRGGNHLHSKNSKQIAGYVEYVKKEEDDKIIPFDFLGPSLI